MVMPLLTIPNSWPLKVEMQRHSSSSAKLLLYNECGKVKHFLKNINQENNTRWDCRWTNMKDVPYHAKFKMFSTLVGTIRLTSSLEADDGG